MRLPQEFPHRYHRLTSRLTSWSTAFALVFGIWVRHCDGSSSNVETMHPTSDSMPRPDRTRWLSEEVRPHEPALRHYLQAHFPSIDADDVVQESYLKLLRARAGGHIASAKGYFFSIARNTALTLFRRSKLYSEVPLSDLPEWRMLAKDGDAAETADLRQRFDLAVEAIDHLPGRCREIVKQAVLERRAPAEIARGLGIAESTVYVQLARGVKRCGDYLREKGERR